MSSKIVRENSRWKMLWGVGGFGAQCGPDLDLNSAWPSWSLRGRYENLDVDVFRKGGVCVFVSERRA